MTHDISVAQHTKVAMTPLVISTKTTSRESDTLAAGEDAVAMKLPRGDAVGVAVVAAARGATLGIVVGCGVGNAVGNAVGSGVGMGVGDGLG